MPTATLDVAPQRMEALKRANVKRRQRADLRQSVKEGRTRIAHLVLDPPECLTTKSRSSKPFTVADLLMWQRGWGRERTRRRLARLEIRPTTELVALSEARRKRLADHLTAG